MIKGEVQMGALSPRPSITISYIANWKGFAVEEMNCNVLENICVCMIVLCIA